MRTLCRLSLFILITGLAASASAREVDGPYGNTTLTAAPLQASAASAQLSRHVDKEAKLPARPAKYDVAYPVHDLARALRAPGAI